MSTGTSWLFALGSAATVLCGGFRAQSTERISVSTRGAGADDTSNEMSISADGRFVVFDSGASNLIDGQSLTRINVFLRDRAAGTTELVSRTPAGTEPNGTSWHPAISGDGRFVAYESEATDLVPGDSNGARDVFVLDRARGVTELVTLSTGGLQANSYSGNPVISGDGRYVAFESFASNLVAAGDANGVFDVFVRDRRAGTTELVSVSTGDVQCVRWSYMPAISADGRFVVFTSAAQHLVPGDTNGAFDVFVRDLEAGTTERVSISTAGVEGNEYSYTGSISADGRYVAFHSWATNLVPTDTNFLADVFVRDRREGTTELVSVTSSGSQILGVSLEPAISADGRFVAFHSDAPLDAQDGHVGMDIFVRDRLAGTTSIASVSSKGAAADDGSFQPAISSDGSQVAFVSEAENLVPGDTNDAPDIFVRDRGPAPVLASCPGDGSASACPCANPGRRGSGCDNSGRSGGGALSAVGSASLSDDGLVLRADQLLPAARGVLLQGRDLEPAVRLGDGLRCVGGRPRRLFAETAVGGTFTIPGTGEPAISSRSAAHGDLIPLGSTRHYQVLYRDPDPRFCPSPRGGSLNTTNAVSVVWSP